MWLYAIYMDTTAENLIAEVPKLKPDLKPSIGQRTKAFLQKFGSIRRPRQALQEIANVPDTAIDRKAQTEVPDEKRDILNSDSATPTEKLRKIASLDTKAETFDLTPEQISKLETLSRNGNFTSACLDRIKKVGNSIAAHPEEIAAVVVPGMLGGLAIIGHTPIPPEILTRLSLSTGFGLLGYAKAEGRGKKIAAGLAGAAIGATAPEGTRHLPLKSVVDMAMPYVDDLPGVAAVAVPGVKKVSQIAALKK